MCKSVMRYPKAETSSALRQLATTLTLALSLLLPQAAQAQASRPATSEDVAMLMEQINLVLTEVRVLRRDVDGLQEDFKELKGDFKELKGDFRELKGDFSELKGEVRELKGDVKGLQDETVGLKGDVEFLKVGQAGLHQKIDAEMANVEIRLIRWVTLTVFSVFALLPFYIRFLRWALGAKLLDFLNGANGKQRTAKPRDKAEPSREADYPAPAGPEVGAIAEPPPKRTG